MSLHVLVLDPDAAFATVLAEAIQGLPAYGATPAFSVREALAELRARPYALAIVDATALGLPLGSLAEELRAAQPQLRLVVIRDEDESPASEGALVQGWLSKPFFAGELAGLLDQAMRQPWPSLPEPPASEPAPGERGNLKAILSALCRETQALSSFVLAGGEVLAQAGSLPPTALDPLSRATVGMEPSLQQVAQALSEEQGFQQVILEGAGFRLALFRVTAAATLVVLTQSETPLGALRYSARQACREIEGLA
ncbi:MAG: hypothetical protein ACUVXG_09545 [Anaerolineae bacterium]